MSRHVNLVVNRQAVRCLRGRWGKGVAGSLFIMGMWMLIFLLEQLCLTALSLLEEPLLEMPLLGIFLTPAQAVASGVFSLISLLVLVPLLAGFTRWFYLLSSGPTPDLRTIFDFLASPRLYGKAVWLWFSTSLRVLIFGGLLSLPTLAVWLGQRYLAVFSSPAAAIGRAALLFLLLVLAVLSLILTAAFGLRYFLAPYYLASGDQVTVREAVRSSVQKMKGHKGQVLTLMVGWLPLWLSCLLLAPLPFVMPYCGCALAINARYLMEQPAEADHAVPQQEPVEAGAQI